MRRDRVRRSESPKRLPPAAAGSRAGVRPSRWRWSCSASSAARPPRLGLVLALRQRRGRRRRRPEACWLGDAVLIAVILCSACCGTKLAPATLGYCRTPFSPAVGWSCAFFIGTIALMALWGLLVGAPGEEGGGSAGGPPAPVVVAIVLLRAMCSVPASRSPRRSRREIAFRGYLFAALTTWRGPLARRAGSPRCSSAPPTSPRRPRRCSRPSRCSASPPVCSSGASPARCCPASRRTRSTTCS